MNLFRVACALVSLAGASIALAQQPTVLRGAQDDPAVSLQSLRPTDEGYAPSSLSPPVVTPDIWVYSDQWRRHDDPAQAVRRKAEARTAQRMQRLAAMKWYGFSNARPQAAAMPFTGRYAPTWIGSGYHRYDWVGGGYPTTAVLTETYDIQR